VELINQPQQVWPHFSQTSPQIKIWRLTNNITILHNSILIFSSQHITSKLINFHPKLHQTPKYPQYQAFLIWWMLFGHPSFDNSWDTFFPLFLLNKNNQERKRRTDNKNRRLRLRWTTCTYHFYKWSPVDQCLKLS
jgi:hypothetical protein